jgi:predicted enzyme related to lactoylglutathione lyase
MAEITSYKPGMFCWTDLQTTDPKAAQGFYTSLFGWKTEDVPSPGGGTYTMARVGGKDVAGMGGMTPDMQAQHMPSHWNVYFAVANADAAAKKATSLGGKVVAPPFDIGDSGRMAVLADPSGAMFCVWQANKHIGAGVKDQPGAPNWAELATRNVDASGSFYTKLFDWRPETMNTGNMKYTVFNVDKEGTGGMMEMRKEIPASVPPNWSVYFVVANCDQSSAKARSLGAKEIVPPTDIPDTGRFAMYMDPQGAAFSILQPTPRS